MVWRDRAVAVVGTAVVGGKLLEVDLVVGGMLVGRGKDQSLSAWVLLSCDLVASEMVGKKTE